MRLIGTWFVAVGVLICLLDLLDPGAPTWSLLGLALAVGGTGLLVASRPADREG